MSEYNIQMNKYNALNVEYDQLYPATKIENVDGLNTALQKKADMFTTLQMDGVDRNVEVSSAGWHRLIEFRNYMQSAILHIKHRYYSDGPCDMLVYVSCLDKYAVHILSATSYLNNTITIDDLRLVSNSTTGKYYLDIHYKFNAVNGIGVDIIGTTAQANWQVDITRMNLESVDTLPDGETVVKTAEWENPPMLLGVEYRTTERYNGKPVYKRAVNIGDITGNGRFAFDSLGATKLLSGELLYKGNLPFTYINGPDLNNSWTRYANVEIMSSKIEVSYFIGSSCGTSKNTVVILRYLKD